LDFDEIHTSLVEEFQVFINGSLALVVGSVKMHEKSSWNMLRSAWVMDQVE
jgi:hypothetical protein